MTLPEFNSNAFHNLLNQIGTVLGIVSLALIGIGCVSLVTGAFDCSNVTTIPPTWLPYLVAVSTGIFIVKTIINVTRDGITGLWKVQPPVADKTTSVVIAGDEDATVKVESDLPHPIAPKGKKPTNPGRK